MFKIGDKIAYKRLDGAFRLGEILSFGTLKGKSTARVRRGNEHYTVNVENLELQTTEILEEYAKQNNIQPLREYIVPIEKRGSILKPPLSQLKD